MTIRSVSIAAVLTAMALSGGALEAAEPVAADVRSRDYGSFVDLIKDSEMVVVGRVLTDVRLSSRPKGRLEGQERMVIDEVLIGKVLPTNVITLIHEEVASLTGPGRSSKRGVVALTRRDKRYLLFLSKRQKAIGYVIVGGAQGAYEIDVHGVVHPADRRYNSPIAQKYRRTPSDLLLADVRQSITGR